MADVFEQLDAGIAEAKRNRRVGMVLSQVSKENLTSKDLMMRAAQAKVSDDPNIINAYKQLQANELKSEADAADAEFNMKAGTALNQEIGGYLKENPSARPMQAVQSGEIKNDSASSTGSFALGTDSFNQNLSNFASQLQNESSLGGIPSSEQQGANQGTQVQSSKTATNTETAYNGLLKGIPTELAQDLIFQYHNGLIKPKDFLKEVAAIKKNLYDISVENNKLDQASSRRIREEGMKSQGEIDKQYVTNEGDLEQQRLINEGALERTFLETASQERRAKEKTNDDLTREDKSLIQIDKTLRNDYIVKQRSEQLQYAGNTIKLLTSDNPVANQAAKTQLARLSGEVGVLTDKDTERFGGSKALVSKLNQKVKEAVSGRLSKENQAFLTDVAQTFYNAAQRSLNERLNIIATGQSEAFNVPLDRIMPLVNSYSISEVGSGNTATVPTAPKPAVQSIDNNTKVINGVTFRKVNGGWQKQ